MTAGLPRVIVPLALWIATIAGVSGCGAMLGPENWPSTTIQGRVHEGGRPIGRGWIELWPTDGARGPFRSAPLNPDGQFTLERANLGTNVIRLVIPRASGVPDPALASILRAVGQFGSPLRVVVRSEGIPPLEIDLRRPGLLREPAVTPTTEESDVSGR